MDEPSPEAERRLTFVLLYGPVVQFARQQGAAEPSVVAMPAQLPLSVDTVFQHPADAAVPDNLAHFCFCPLLKLHGVSELSFCLTDSSGAELHGVSLQCLHALNPTAAQGGEAPAPRPRHRPVALCMLGGRPLLEGMRHVLRALFQREVHRLPSEKTVKELAVRAGYDANGMGLVMGDRNIIMQVELGRTAARERRLRPGDVVTKLNGESLAGLRLSELLKQQAEKAAAAEAAATAEAEAAAAAARDASPAAPAQAAPAHSALAAATRSRALGAHQLVVTRSHERLPPTSRHTEALRETVGALLGALAEREQDVRWLVSNPFWLPAPLEPLFRGLRYGEAAFVYLLCGALTDQKILLHANDPALLLPAAQALRSLVAPLTFSSTYVPYLPTTLLHPSDAVTLINDSTSPYAARAIRAQFGAILSHGLSLTTTGTSSALTRRCCSR